MATSRDDSTVFGRRELWILTGLVAVALLARAPRLHESLWYDEIAAWRDYGAHGVMFPLANYFDPANHVLHSALTAVAVSLLAPADLGNEPTLRLVALLASLLSVIAMFGLARRALPTRVAMVAAGLMGLAPVSVLSGVEARGYSMMIALAALATMLLLSAQERGGLGRWVLYALVCGLGVWTHAVTVFVPIGHGLVLLGEAALCRRPDRLVRGGLALLAAAALTLLMYAPIIGQMLELRGILARQSDDQPGLIGPEGLHLLLQLGGAWSWWAALPGLLLLALGIAAARNSPRLQRALLYAGAGLLPYLALILFTGSWTYARFGLFLIPAALLGIPAGLSFIAAKHRAAALAATIVLIGAWIGDLVTRPAKQPLRDATSYVLSAQQKGDRTLAIGLRAKVLDAYGNGLDLTYALRHGADLETDLQPAHRWVIIYYPRSVDASIYDRLRAGGFSEAARFAGWVDWCNGDVLVWERSIRVPDSAPPGGGARQADT